MSLEDYTIRKFSSGDKQAVTDIFNYFVENSYAAYPDKKVGLIFLEKLKEPVISDSFYVVETSKKKIIGFGLVKRHHTYEVFNRTAELTYFILPEHARRGLGSKLLTMLLDDAKKADVDALLAHISSLNEGSLIFHQKHGFMECGRFKRIGRKNGEDFDVIWMQRFI
jgi:phosphinothricin acetyltransferase